MMVYLGCTKIHRSMIAYSPLWRAEGIRYPNSGYAQYLCGIENFLGYIFKKYVHIFVFKKCVYMCVYTHAHTHKCVCILIYFWALSQVFSIWLRPGCLHFISCLRWFFCSQHETIWEPMPSFIYYWLSFYFQSLLCLFLFVFFLPLLFIYGST